MMKRTLPPMDGPPTVLDLFDGVGNSWAPGLFVRTVTTTWDSWWIVGQCNGTSAAKTVKVEPSMLPIDISAGAPPPPPEASSLCVLDIWGERYLGGLNDHNEMVTAPVDATLWRVWRMRPTPWVAGCDRHLSEGSFAIKRVAWAASTSASAAQQRGTLAVTLRGLTAEATHVRFTLPTPWKVHIIRIPAVISSSTYNMCCSS